MTHRPVPTILLLLSFIYLVVPAPMLTSCVSQHTASQSHALMRAEADSFLRSMQPAVAAVILYASFSMAKALKNKDHISTWLLLGLSVALCFAGVSAVYLLLMGAVLGALVTIREVKRHVR